MYSTKIISVQMIKFIKTNPKIINFCLKFYYKILLPLYKLSNILYYIYYLLFNKLSE